VSRASGRSLADTQPVVGSAVFRHESGSFDAVIRCLAPSGISSRALMHLELAAPAVTAQTLAIRDGYPEMVLQGSPGVSYALQTLMDFSGDHRWVTVQRLCASTSGTTMKL